MMRKSWLLSFLLICPALRIDAALLIVPDQYPTIQAAVDASQDNDRILIRPGIYTGNGNRDIAISLSYLSIEGAGNPEETIMDLEGSESDPHRAFDISGTGWWGQIILSGMTIRNGYTVDPDGAGAGIRSTEAPLTIRGCIFENNRSSGSMNGQGGAVFFASPSECLFCFNSVFRSNSAINAGAIWTVRGIISNCVFETNEASNAGAVIIYEGAIEHCRFDGNYADIDGGAMVCGNVLITDSALVNNQCNRYGGGIDGSEAENLVLDRCTFKGNTAVEGGACELRNVQFFDITNCIWTNNRAFSYGGALLTEGIYSGSIVNNTFFNNTAEISGGAIVAFNVNHVLVRNSILWMNQSPSGEAVYLTDVFKPGTSAQADIDYSVVMKSECFVEGEGCSISFGDRIIEESPGLTDPENGNYQPGHFSNCIDTGMAGGSTTMDVNGDPRTAGAGIDIGAIEVQEVLPEGFHIFMADTNITTGDLFSLDILGVINGTSSALEGMLLLEINGAYYFYPEWMPEPVSFAVPVTYPRWGKEVFHFSWPDKTGGMTGLHFMGGLFNPETMDLAGCIDAVDWSYY